MLYQTIGVDIGWGSTETLMSSIPFLRVGGHNSGNYMKYCGHYTFLVKSTRFPVLEGFLSTKFSVVDAYWFMDLANGTNHRLPNSFAEVVAGLNVGSEKIKFTYQGGFVIPIRLDTRLMNRPFVANIGVQFSF